MYLVLVQAVWYDVGRVSSRTHIRQSLGDTEETQNRASTEGR